MYILPPNRFNQNLVSPAAATNSSNQNGENEANYKKINNSENEFDYFTEKVDVEQGKNLLTLKALLKLIYEKLKSFLLFLLFKIKKSLETFNLSKD